jgi:hypothetical protein
MRDYHRLLKLYRKIKHNICIPTHIVFFDVKNSLSLKRRNVYSKEKLYHNWFNPIFLTHFREFYKKELGKILSVELISINTSNMCPEEVYNEVDKII